HIFRIVPQRPEFCHNRPGAGRTARRWAVPLALAGLAVMAALWWPARGRIAHGVNDFLSFYSGARLMGTAEQYNPARYRELQLAVSGWEGDAWQFIRLPFYAVLLRPLGHLPYPSAYRLWQFLAVAAVVAFVLLWPATGRAMTLAACCWSYPLSAAFANGQDVGWLLLLVTLALRAAATRPMLAGAIFALCGIKFHLFLLLPLALAAQRRWRMMAGLLAAGAALLALSFAVAGPDWPAQYAHTILNARVSPAQTKMPNLHGLVSGWPQPLVWSALLSLATAAAVWLAARRAGFEIGLAAALAGGLLVSQHAYVADCALLIPALLIVLAHGRAGWLRYLALALLAPPAYYLLTSGHPAGWVAPVAIMILVGGMAWYSRRGPRDETCGAGAG
ncbi:MAG: glycosyltransferase 87 family protein, partial [Planctomycetota bacterium]